MPTPATRSKPARCPRCGSARKTLGRCAACPLRVTITPAGREALARAATAAR